MANNWSVHVTPKNAVRKVGDLMNKIERTVLNEAKLVRWAGPKVREAVASRTAQGKNVRDANFTLYSKKYADKEKGGRRRPVTLDDTGLMLQLLDFKTTGNRSGKVYVKTGGTPNREAIAAAHHRGEGNVPKRQWIGMSPTDMKKLDRETLLRLEKELGLSGPGLQAIFGYRKISVSAGGGRTAFAVVGRAPWKYTHPR